MCEKCILCIIDTDAFNFLPHIYRGVENHFSLQKYALKPSTVGYRMVLTTSDVDPDWSDPDTQNIGEAGSSKLSLGKIALKNIISCEIKTTIFVGLTLLFPSFFTSGSGSAFGIRIQIPAQNMLAGEKKYLLNKL